VTSSSDQTRSLRAFTPRLVGSLAGSGIFAVPAAFGRTTGGLGALTTWTIAGVGMLMLAFVFQTLARRKPELDSGIYAYAKAGFGDYPGFASAAGYWIGACLADVACLVLIKPTLGLFLLWAVHFMILRRGKEAAALNTIATVAKIVPIGLFIVIAIAAFKADVFALSFWGGEEPITRREQGKPAKFRVSLSKRVALRRKCLSLQKKRSTRLRWR
jgi:arginine:ornithine antiporter/lysine permease